TLASQMAPATGESRSIEAACRGTDRPLTGSVSWRTFPGWEAAYTEFEDPRPTAPPEIPLQEGAVWPLDPPEEDAPNPVLIQDETQPPGRYREHTLVKAMKDAGIGRPSTYARTIEKLEEREFVEPRDGALAPTERGRAIWLDAAPLYALGEEGEDAAELFSTDFTAEMEAGLDRVATGQEAAAERWERWRELVRALHEAARERKDSGASTLKQHEQLRRFLANAPASFADAIPGGEMEALSYREAGALIQAMREAGVDPAPTEAQMGYLRRLLDDLDLPEEERAEILGVDDPDGIRTAGHASGVIDELQRIFDERRPPSGKQRRFIEDLLKETGVTPEEAAALVGVASLDDLTGGREGTASALIEALEERKRADAAGAEGGA
ncbi:MAG TPA: DNA topoisomerase, partial [Longimicrobiales bacterium]|nr:DNA topoisomerase [Longimicrobiales bacterium]